jgi:putative transcriptional regulator
MQNFYRARVLGVAIGLAVSLLGWSFAEAAEPAPAAGSFLVATAGQPGVFSKCVVLLIAYGPHGALGVIVNRPTGFNLSRALPDASVLNGHDGPLYFGGPVALERVTLLIRSKVKPPNAIHVTGDIYASESMKTLRAVSGHKFAGARFRGYAGYAGWAPGQLDTEIASGGWHVLRANPTDVFSHNPAGLWHKLIRQPNRILVQAYPPYAMPGRSRGDRTSRGLTLHL